MKVTSLVLLLAASFLLSGCLTSPNPFYEAADITQDDRIVGDYGVPDADEAFLIQSDMDHKGSYLVRCYEGKHREYWIECIGTLFKVGGKTFLDVYPNQDSSFRHIGGTPPGLVHIAHSLVFQPLHLVARVEFNEQGEVGFSFPQRNQLDALLKRDPSLRQFYNRTTFLLPMQTPDLRKLLEKHGTSDEVFPKPDKFQKPRTSK